MLRPWSLAGNTRHFLSKANRTQISNIVHALDPVKIAVEAICRRDANFITAETRIEFSFEDIQSYPSSEYKNQITEAINQRYIQERYVEASVIIAYLHNPIAKLENVQ